MAKEIWVYAQKDADVVKELLAKSQEIAKVIGEYKVCAVALGDDLKDAKNLGDLGAEKVYAVEHTSLKEYRCDLYAKAIEKLVQKYQPEYFFFGATAIGSELAPTVVALVKTGLAAHCIDLRYGKDRLNCMVPAFGGKVISEIYIPNARPVMASVRPGILQTEEAAKYEAELVCEDTSFLNDETSTEEFLGFEENQKDTNNIEDADVVVSAGRGITSDASWNALTQLADKVDGAIAWSRSFIDTGRVKDESSMIGTSGKSVKPKLLVNAGVSGAAQYVCGIARAKKVISINKDPKAPIFAYSDYGVVGDAEKILTAVAAKL
ncbi:MAG: electron transfer flavoprotein subunit alpha/FixB family protein [Solobacterium sp.]|nr:electron transfer flavoprotein subunit alpha/FixB family protein [Solobacterium sp.]